ncbi:MAG: class I SAM-dependent methyltransferase family protein [Candidatus Magasanikbacteria bacterium]|nr:class I SAM-dependent methyltransferase family protein [Candidatus Magasanikbacteria bacterium]
MNGRVASTVVEIATIPELPEVETGTVAIMLPVKSAEFEKRRWPYILTMPISWLLTLWVILKKSICRWQGKPDPNINTFWFDGLGLSNRAIKEGAASWKALDIIYNHPFGHKKGLSGFVDDFWIGMINAQAVRNRLKLVKQEIRRAILQFSNHQEVRLLSLAAGSAQGIIEVMAEFKIKGIRVRALLLDIDQTALDYAMQLALRHGVGNQIETVKASVAQVVRVSKDFRPQVIEMLGLLDYIPQDKDIRLVEKIRQSLQTKGIFLTCNICHNMEMHFLTWVINWPMIYRTPAELAEIVTEAGFSDYRLIYEPLKLHGLVIAQKE